MQFIFDSLIAFNVNAASHLAYAVSNNLWILMIAAAAVASIIISVKESIHETVREEQQAL